MAAALNKTTDHDVVADIASSTEVYGLHATLKRVSTKDPKVADAITNLVTAADALSLAVSQRELHLLQLQPGRPRAFVSDGREYTLNGDQIIWADSPDRPEKVEIQKLDKLPYYDTIEMDTPDLSTPVIEDDDDDDDDDSPRRRKGRGR